MNIHVWADLFDGTVQVAHAHGILAGLPRMWILRRTVILAITEAADFGFGSVVPCSSGSLLFGVGFPGLQNLFIQDYFLPSCFKIRNRALS